VVCDQSRGRKGVYVPYVENQPVTQYKEMTSGDFCPETIMVLFDLLSIQFKIYPVCDYSGTLELEQEM